MPGFGDSAFIVILALLLFGPKKLPVLARQLGKLMADFRRASNEFRSQMEEELRIAEQADRQKQVSALEASTSATTTATAASDSTAAISEPHTRRLHPTSPHLWSRRNRRRPEASPTRPPSSPAHRLNIPQTQCASRYQDRRPPRCLRLALILRPGTRLQQRTLRPSLSPPQANSASCRPTLAFPLHGRNPHGRNRTTGSSPRTNWKARLPRPSMADLDPSTARARP